MEEPAGTRAGAGRGVAEERPLSGEAGAAARRAGHEQALRHAGAVRLAHAIRPYGAMRKEVLEEVAGASHWSAGAFQQALDAAVEEGLLRRLGFGFYQAVL